jgi:hypothetical protein
MSTTGGRIFSLRPFDSPDLMIWPCSEAHLANFIVFQTHLSLRHPSLSSVQPAAKDGRHTPIRSEERRPGASGVD